MLDAERAIADPGYVTRTLAAIPERALGDLRATIAVHSGKFAYARTDTPGDALHVLLRGLVRGAERAEGKPPPRKNTGDPVHAILIG